jgi:hypothetical protein
MVDKDSSAKIALTDFEIHDTLGTGNNSLKQVPLEESNSVDIKRQINFTQSRC